MNEGMPRSGDTITPDESMNLMRLYSDLSDLALEARKAIRDGAASTTLSRIRSMNEQIARRFDNIRAIARCNI